MSNSLAIAAVTSTLRKLLDDGVRFLDDGVTSDPEFSDLFVKTLPPFKVRSTSSDNEDNSGGNLIPRRLDIKANLTSAGFVVSKFMADNLMVNLHLINNSVQLNDFTFNFFDGTISGNAEIRTVDSGGFSITCNTRNSDINIHELFSAFNNFAQNFIIDRNIAGSLDGTVIVSGAGAEQDRHDEHGEIFHGVLSLGVTGEQTGMMRTFCALAGS